MGVFRDHRLFRLKFHFTLRLSRDSSARKQSWPLMVHYFSTRSRGVAVTTAFPALATKFLRLFTDVHHRTCRMSSSLSLSFFYLHTQTYTPPPGCCSVSRRVSSQPPQRIPDSLTPLCFGCFALSLSLSRSIFLSLFHTVSSSFLSNVSAFPSPFLGLSLRWWQRARFESR